MTPLLQEFADALAVFGSDLTWRYRHDPDNTPALVIAAACQEVGDLAIHDDGEELTVVIGELHHTHFSAYNYEGDALEERLKAASEEAARFVVDIVKDRVGITVWYKDANCIGSSATDVTSDKSRGATLTYPLSGWPLQKVRTERYLWSGRVGDISE